LSDRIINQMKKEIDMKAKKKALPSSNLFPCTLRFNFFDFMNEDGMIENQNEKKMIQSIQITY